MEQRAGRRRRSVRVVKIVAGVLLATLLSHASVAWSAQMGWDTKGWTDCFKKLKPSVSQLGGPLPPGAKVDLDYSVTMMERAYPGGNRAFGFVVKSPSVLSWYLARYPYRGETFRIPSVKKGIVELECERADCEIHYLMSDATGTRADSNCPPQVGQNTVNAALVPSTPGALGDKGRCAGFTGFFMTSWGPMQLTNGKGTYLFRTRSDNTIDGTVSKTAKGWALTGNWRDLTGSGPFRFEMDQYGNFLGTYTKGGPLAAIGVNDPTWAGQCRATMPTELSTRDDQASRDAVTNSPPLDSARPDATEPTTVPAGSFTPLDPSTVPCGGFNGHLWSVSFGDIVLNNGVGTYKFGREPEAPFVGTVTPTPTGWSFVGTYGSGASGGTIRLEQDTTGRATGRYTPTGGSGSVVSAGCTG